MQARQIRVFDDSAEGWERALYAFLAEKERRSGSRRTVDGYSRLIQDFFGKLGKPPDEVTSQEVFAWAHGRGASGKEPSAVTIGARIACVSSFYKMGQVGGERQSRARALGHGRPRRRIGRRSAHCPEIS